MQRLTRAHSRRGGRVIRRVTPKQLDSSATSDKARDSVAPKRTRDALSHRLAMEELVAAISTSFINVQANQVDSHIRHALRLVGQFTQADRAYVMLFSDDQRTVVRSYTWEAEGIAVHPGGLVGLCMEPFKWLMRQLSHQQIIHVPRVADLLPDAGAERDIWEKLGVRSLVVAPIGYQDWLAGCIGLNAEQAERLWSAEDARLIKLVGEILVNALARMRAEEELRRSLSRAVLLNRVLAATSASLDVHTVLETVCTELARELGLPQAACALLSADRRQLTVVAEFRNPDRPSALGAVIPVVGNPATQYVLEQRVPLFITDAQNDPRMAVIHDLERQRGTVSLLIVPLLVRDQVIGTLGLDATEPREFSPEEIALAQSAAAAASHAIHNAQLHSALQEELARRQELTAQLSLSLQQKEALLREIHHRVKNNLQVIASLLGLQSQYIQDPKALAVFQEGQARVRAMGLIHEQLYSSGDLTRLDVAAYVRELAGQLIAASCVHPHTVDLQVEASEVWLGIDTAVPCGLIINELISNALKHAFPADFEGHARVTLRMWQEGDEVQLTVSDNGIGLPTDLDYRHAETLGLQLVMILTRQLEGTVDLVRESGTTFHIRFPSESGKRRYQALQPVGAETDHV